MSIIISPIAKKENKTHNSKKDYEEFENRKIIIYNYAGILYLDD